MTSLFPTDSRFGHLAAIREFKRVRKNNFFLYKRLVIDGSGEREGDNPNSDNFPLLPRVNKL